MIFSHIEYCLTSWSLTCASTLKPLESLYKRSLKVFAKKPQSYHYCKILEKYGFNFKKSLCNFHIAKWPPPEHLPEVTVSFHAGAPPLVRWFCLSRVETSGTPYHPLLGSVSPLALLKNIWRDGWGPPKIVSTALECSVPCEVACILCDWLVYVLYLCVVIVLWWCLSGAIYCVQYYMKHLTTSDVLSVYCSRCCMGAGCSIRGAICYRKYLRVFAICCDCCIWQMYVLYCVLT